MMFKLQLSPNYLYIPYKNTQSQKIIKETQQERKLYNQEDFYPK